MNGRVILFGAGGYTGRLAAQAMVRAGLAPVLAGRNRDALTALCDSLVPLAPRAAAGPTVAIADASDTRSVRALLESPDDVLVSTVGPFVRLGRPAIEAAVDAGSAYVDSTGESPFIREVFEDYGPRAQASGARLLTAFGYDYVPGNLAGAVAIARARQAGTPAARVEVGYFVTGAFGISTGTKASAAGILLAPSYSYERGVLRTVRAGARTRRFAVGGKQRDGLSIGATEQFALPRLDRSVSDVGVYLGWGGRMTRVASAGSTVLAGVGVVPGVRSAITSGIRRAVGDATGEGPSQAERASARTVAQADAYDAVGRQVASVRVEGPSPYDLTADLLAWAAAKFVTGPADPGALGPADAFGLDALVDGCADLGLAVAS